MNTELCVSVLRGDTDPNSSMYLQQIMTSNFETRAKKLLKFKTNIPNAP